MNKNYIEDMLAMDDGMLNIELANISINDFRQILKLALNDQHTVNDKPITLFQVI